MSVIKVDYGEVGGGGIIVKQGQFTAVKNGTATVTIPELTQIRTLSQDGNTVSYALDDDNVEWFNNSHSPSSYGIQSVSGNVFTFKYDAAQVIHYLVSGT